MLFWHAVVYKEIQLEKVTEQRRSSTSTVSSRSPRVLRRAQPAHPEEGDTLAWDLLLIGLP